MVKVTNLLEVDLGSVLESKLWRYGVLKACI